MSEEYAHQLVREKQEGVVTVQEYLEGGKKRTRLGYQVGAEDEAKAWLINNTRKIVEKGKGEQAIIPEYGYPHLPVDFILKHPEILTPTNKRESRETRKNREGRTPLESIPRNELVGVYAMYALISDAPGYTDVMTRFPEAGADLHNRFMKSTRELLDNDPVYKDMMLVGTAGDEDTLLVSVKADPLILAACAIDREILFLQELQKSPKELQDHLIAAKKTQTPFINVGVTHGNGVVGLMELAHNPKTGERGDTRIAMVSPVLLRGKELGTKGTFYRSTGEAIETSTNEMRRATSTSEMQRTNGNGDPPDFAIDPIPEHIELYRKFIENAGLTVEAFGEGNSHVAIEFPYSPDTEENEINAVMQRLASASQSLKEQSVFLHRSGFIDTAVQKYRGSTSEQEHNAIRAIEVRDLGDCVRGLSWPRDREAGKAEAMAEHEGRDGATGYITLQGFDKLRQSIDAVLSNSPQYRGDENAEQRQIIVSRMVFDAIRLNVYRGSEDWMLSNWRCENIEISPDDEVRVIVHHNVLQKEENSVWEDPTHEPFWDLVGAMETMDARERSVEVIEYLTMLYGNEMEEAGLTGGSSFDKLLALQMRLTEYDLKVGIGMEFPDELAENSQFVISDNSDEIDTSRRVRGGGTSKAARRVGGHGHKRYKKYPGQDEKIIVSPGISKEVREKHQKSYEGWKAAEADLELANRDNCIVMRNEDRVRLGIPDQIEGIDTKVAVAKSVILKGMDPEDVAFVPKAILYAKRTSLLQQA
ncbi:hypothetical protein C4564_01075 [Candidatus Microgenomates bacterium]|nr:MAG: hypothetical protein C4564_01075 [Candidatus Microgenomates bacterium]